MTNHSLTAGLSAPLKNRIRFLFVGNLLLLGIIFCLIREGGSFGHVIQSAGPNVAPLVLAGLALTGIIFTGAIDLSIGSLIVVGGTVFGILFHHEFSPAMSFAGTFLAVVLLSCWNGMVIRLLKIPAIIVTLAGLTFYRGFSLILADLFISDFGGSLSVQNALYHGPGKEYAGTILACTIVLALVWESFSKTPRTWLALGSSEEACRLHGLLPGRVLQSSFFVSGLLLGIATLTYVTRLQVIEPARMARGFELEVIGAIVLGGTNIFGGEGSYLGTILGTFFLYFTGEVLIYAGVNPYYQDVIRGGLIIAVIGFDCAIHIKRKRLEELR
jgi:ribose transport system permease protein